MRPEADRTARPWRAPRRVSQARRCAATGRWSHEGAKASSAPAARILGRRLAVREIQRPRRL